jgi:hypothetical protein
VSTGGSARSEGSRNAAATGDLLLPSRLAAEDDDDRHGGLARSRSEGNAGADCLRRTGVELRLAAALDDLQDLGTDLAVARNGERHDGSALQAGSARRK